MLKRVVRAIAEGSQTDLARPVLTMPAALAPAELPPKRAAAKAALPLSPAPAAKPKEAFVWDESQGID